MSVSVRIGGMQEIILASGSPRRFDLLTAMGVSFRVIPSAYDEHLDDTRTPDEVAMELGLGKALAVADLYPDAIVIGSDTIVCIDGKQLGKPADATEAFETLRDLSGRENQVVTSVAIVCKATGLRRVGVYTANVLFKTFNDALVRAYVATGDPLDKAGSYGIQSGAASLVEHIQGDFDAIIGLPTHLLAEYLNELGITSTPVDLECPVPQVATR